GWVRPEFWSQRQRRFPRKPGLAAVEGSADGFAEERPGELKRVGQVPEVEEVLHPAVGDAQHDHRLELLRHDRLPGVGAQFRGRELQHGGVGDVGRAGHYGVPEAYVDLKLDPGLAEMRPAPDADAFVVLVLLD